MSGQLGRGGRGIVYKAVDPKLKREVAMKMILAGPLASVSDLQYFRREVEAIAQMKHPNIVKIYEVSNFEGQPFFTMELLEGGCLTERVKKYASNPQDVARLLIAVARAIQHAHERGFIHRDLKPSNILFDGQGACGH